ncbi:amidohydrolase family protein [Spartinivicinus ruber]|uniref:amidohydrolase family protein n=1 Tax=Spartinivicinus ruber TaxID=2683272 RepID=UPI0013D0ACBE|nr:amidohydrolase family protein [Spartinivicinus ruber]
MNKSNIEQAYVMGMPVIKKWDAAEPNKPRSTFSDDAPLYYYSRTDEILAREIETLPKEDQLRLHPFLSGFNPTDLHAAEQIEQELKWRPGFWKGIGEILTRHDSLTALTTGERARANHPALMKIYQLAARYKLPVILHSNITSTKEKKPIYLPELEEAIKSNPKTYFIWAHAGVSTTLVENQSIEFVLTELRRMLTEYPNLYVLASWQLLDLMLEDNKPNKQWIKLITDYPSHFMIGSDVVNQFNIQNKILNRWQPILDALPKKVAKAVAVTNMQTIVNNKRTFSVKN